MYALPRNSPPSSIPPPLRHPLAQTLPLRPVPLRGWWMLLRAHPCVLLPGPHDSLPPRAALCDPSRPHSHRAPPATPLDAYTQPRRLSSPPRPASPGRPPVSQDDFLSKILHTVSSQAVKEPSSYSLSDEQLQKITQLKAPEQKPAAPASRVSGAVAPNPKELEAFLRSHPHVQVYANQDTTTAQSSARPEPAPQPMAVRVAVWDALKNRKLTGAEAPTEKELAGFLQRYPHCEIYSGQRPAPTPAAEPASEPLLKPSFKWVDKPLAGKWEEPVKPRAPLDAAPQPMPMAPGKRRAEMPLSPRGSVAVDCGCARAALVCACATLDLPVCAAASY